MVSPSLCIKCKGKLLCGAKKCPILERHSSQKKVVSNIKGTSFQGSSPPSVFVSWKGYPKVSIAPLSPTEQTPKAALLDSPEKWFSLSQEEIVSFRESLVHSTRPISVHEAANPSYSLLDLQDLAMSDKPTDVEISLFKKPSPSLSFSDTTAPLGPRASLKKFSLTENTSVPQKVDYLVSDTAVKANTALSELYDSGLPVSYLYKLLSLGTLGVRKKRKLVPLRWSITAADDSLSKKLIEEKVKQFQQLGEILLFSSIYLDNRFFILLIPSEWSFEQLECWLPGGTWTAEAKTSQVIQDHEFYKPRKSYASNVEGAYYSARLAVAEKLVELKRQSSAIVFREIGSEYNIPLGVWVIRETVRNALSSKPLNFFDLDLALEYVSNKLSVPLSHYLAESKLIDNLKKQRRLTEWFS